MENLILTNPTNLGYNGVYQDISKQFNNPNTNITPNYVDLFCGAGGLSLGLEWAGLKGECAIEFNKDACNTYRKNFSHKVVEGDITKEETKRELYDIIGDKEIDVVVGGFPCQGFSLVGHRNENDSRNVLYKELLAIVEKLKPKVVVCENVKGILSMKKGKVVETILSDFQEIGYHMDFKVLCATDFGVPQLRERVIFMGNRLGHKNYFPKPIVNPENYRTVKDAIGDLMDKDDDVTFSHIRQKHTPEMIERFTKTAEGEHAYESYSSAYKKLYWNKPSHTLLTTPGGNPVHPILNKCITSREMARLQSFPDDFLFAGSQGSVRKQVGNAVPPLMAKAIGCCIKLTLFEDGNVSR